MATAKETTTNLCDSCMLHPAECSAPADQLEYGNAAGNDNVISCPLYYDCFIAVEVDRDILHNHFI